MKFSFDFDSTLSRKSVQKVAKQLIALGYEVHVVTSRYEDSLKYADPKLAYTFNKDLFRVTDHLGIKRENIHFMNMVSKHKFFLENPGFLFHLDDDPMEIISINVETDVKGIVCDYNGNQWKEILIELLEDSGVTIQ